MSKIVVTLNEREKAALIFLARAEVRHPRDQIRILVRNELERLGYLQSTASTEIKNCTEEHCDH